MPKRGGSRGRSWRNEDHFEHDDRGPENIRRVSFKPSSNMKKKTRFLDSVIRQDLLTDNDISMAANSFENRLSIRGNFRGRGGRMNSPGPRMNMNQQRKFHPGNLPWYQVTIPFGSNHSKEVILNALMSELDITFIPLMYKISNNAAIFYVDDFKVAEKLFYADRKILLPDGYKLIVKVRSNMPLCEVNDGVTEKIKTAMGRRYNPATKALDLTKFHYDPEFADIFCALSRPMVMISVMNIITENIPDLEALNLNDNKLVGFEHLKSVLNKFKHLKILYLAENRIPYVSSLTPLKVLPLVELNLKGNPLVSKFNDHDAYISNVRKRFTKLAKLDEMELPPTIGFDVAEDTALPPRQQSFLINPAGMDIVRQFLTQYYAIYDSDSRQPLLDAYHENAIMSLCSNYNVTDGSSPADKLTSYIHNGRNLIRLQDPTLRRKNLKTGRLQVVAFLSELPKSQHDLLGSSVDLMVYTPTMMMITLNGVFKETGTQHSPAPMRAFHRTLLIVPQGAGYCIQHDMLYVTNATRQQVEHAFKSLEPVAAAPAPTPAAAASATPDDAQKMQMVTAMVQQSSMNTHWSTECLNSSGWDYQRALQVFTQMHSEGKIPPDAFVK